MNTPEQDIQRALFEIDLKEVEIVFAQGHTRMTIVATLTNISVALAGALLTTIATIYSLNREPPLIFFLIMPLPFFLFAFLVLREDLLMVHHDFYLYRLRERLLDRLGRLKSEDSLRFLSEIKSAKIGGRVNVFTLLSALRYGTLFVVLVSCLSWFCWNACLSFSAHGWINATLLALNVALLIFLTMGMCRLDKLHKANETLVPQSKKTLAQGQPAEQSG